MFREKNKVYAMSGEKYFHKEIMCNIIIREINDREKKGYTTGEEENQE